MQIKNFSDLTPELIEWEDIAAPDETWPSAKDVEDWYADSADGFVEQVGFVIYEDDHNIIFADSYIESMELFGNVTKIPKSVIRKRIPLYEKNT